jgi:hypothetical protein
MLLLLSRMSKRKRFVITSLVLAIGFFILQFIDVQNYKFIGIGILGFLTLLLFIWSLREGLGRNPTLLVLILPFAFTISVGFFWFLLPTSWLSRIPVIIVFGIGIYALSLTSNIYTVAAIRTIALFRAARGVGFLLTLVTMFLIFDTIISLRTNILLTSLLVFINSFFLYLQGFWSVTLEDRFSKQLILKTLISSVLMGEYAAGMYFWPVTVVVGSLFLTVVAYVLLGLGQAKLEGRLFKQTVREYLMVGAVVFIVMFFSTHWGG